MDMLEVHRREADAAATLVAELGIKWTTAYRTPAYRVHRHRSGTSCATSLSASVTRVTP